MAAALVIKAVSIEVIDLTDEDAIAPLCEMQDNLHEYVAGEVGGGKRPRLEGAAEGGDRARIAELEGKLRESEGLAERRKKALRLLVHGTAPPACDLCFTGMEQQGGGWKRLHKTGCGHLLCNSCWVAMRGGGCPWKTCVLKDLKGKVLADDKGQTSVISCFSKYVVAPKDFESDFMKEVAFVRGFLKETCSEEEGGPVPPALQAYRERSL
ncbi:hypothetical protein T484DRAFT_1957732 [Baffinella frigidus]|nr:hypothetical protein T484DRAFT_1957732 [Cryptophyta sp. CCMP2293]